MVSSIFTGFVSLIVHTSEGIGTISFHIIHICDCCCHFQMVLITCLGRSCDVSWRYFWLAGKPLCTVNMDIWPVLTDVKKCITKYLCRVFIGRFTTRCVPCASLLRLGNIIICPTVLWLQLVPDTQSSCVCPTVSLGLPF